MDLGVRDWMIIIGVLLILAVLLDGYRRVRNERRGRIRMSLNKRFLNSAGDGDEPSTSELPNGGARVIGRGGSGSMDDLRDRREPSLGEIDDLELDQTVPMLMESVISANLAGELAGDDSDEPEHGDLFAQESAAPAAKVSASAADSKKQPSASTAKSAEEEKRSVESEVASADAPSEKSSRATQRVEAGATASHKRAQEIVVINVIARDKPFKGADLLHILLACDLRFGKMNIFHRHEQANGRGQVQFSVANSVEPGTFNLDAIDDFSTPGVCFFMSVPGPEDPITAFECMVETAHCLVKNLDGEMRDESRSVMTMQTLEHCRQRLQEFERRQLAQA